MPLVELPEELQLPFDKVAETIEERIERHLYNTNSEEIYIGLSGGLDSSVTAYLAVNALGNDRVVGVTMNDSITPEQDRCDQEKVIKNLGIDTVDFGITTVYNMMKNKLKRELRKRPPEKLEKISEYKFRTGEANLKPRLRMAILYYFANMLGTALGTGDKSEIMIGYFTKFGDGAGDFFPIGGLYKTQVRALGAHFHENQDFPESIIIKKSSPGLELNQTAEEDLGLDYKTIDLILHYGFERKLEKEQIARKLDIELSIIDGIYKRVSRSQHKREPPSIVDLNDLVEYKLYNPLPAV